MRTFSLLLVFFLAHSLRSQADYFTLQDGAKLYVEVSGKGQPMLFIPGWTMTHKFFEQQKEHFSKNYQVITYDPRGQGRADKTTYKNNYAAHAADLRALILEKGWNEIVLVGWSSGCLTMFEYLRAYGTDRMAKLVFIDEPPKWVGNPKEEWVYGTFDGYRNTLKGMLAKPSDPNGIIDWMLNDPIESSTRSWMREEILMTPPHVALSLYIDGIACDYNEEVRKLSIPSLFMIRESWYDQGNEWLKTNAPQAEVTSISSHAMFWERPKVFNEKLSDFLK